MASTTHHPTTSPPSTLPDLHTKLSQLESREHALHQHLHTLRQKLPLVTANLQQLNTLRTSLAPHLETATHLNTSLLAPASATASRVSSSVTALDTEQARLLSVLRIVERVIDLKSCITSLTTCLSSQRYEEAAEFVNRARQIPDEIIKSRFAIETVGPEEPKATLERAQEELCAVFVREFESATAAGDGERVTTYFKLFPLIGREETGLGAYSRYVCAGVSKRARDLIAQGERERGNGMFYAAVLTRILEYVAGLIGVHAPLVGEWYGWQGMGRVVWRVQTEIDVMGGLVVDMFGDDKAISRKVAEAKAYAYPFLMGSFNSGLQPRGLGIARAVSPAMGQRGSQEETEIDIKEVDAVLSEMSFVLHKWALYFRFLAVKEQEWAALSLPEDAPLPPLTLPTVLTESTFTQKLTTHIHAPFLTLSTFFFRRSLEKAFLLDELPDLPTFSSSSSSFSPPSAPLISSAIDDISYLLNALLLRTLHTSTPSLTSALIPTYTRILTSDFIGIIQRKLRDDYYPRTPASLTAPLDEKTSAFLVQINNLDTAASYTSRIVSRLLSPKSQTKSEFDFPTTPIVELFPFPGDAEKVTALLEGLASSFSTKASELQTDAINTAFNQLIKPRLRPLLAEAFAGVDYSAFEEPPAEDDSDDEAVPPEVAVKVRFERGWRGMMGPLRSILCEAPFAKLLGIVCSALAQLLERRIWAYLSTQKQGRGGGSIGGGVSPLGGIKLERDISGIVGVVCMVVGDEGEYDPQEEGGLLTEEDVERVRRGLLREG
ncbi:COG4-domain-containing protein [Ascobolus immersus RN42]|uniref:Conserved oligomeric Golgi complex subunit 4 n=1 Tax=Ascobolus immersus RN42 TaxID=1160509 RepID=A0A3N4HKK9_ASCIM|nr:COG4-domain-containing protein [Ascobolus immersus RN42]